MELQLLDEETGEIFALNVTEEEYARAYINSSISSSNVKYGISKTSMLAIKIVFPAQAAIYWAEKGRRVVYISPTPLERRPAVCHDRNDPTVAALDLMRFIYLPDYETLIEQLVKLHTYAAVPSVLLIDDLDNYFTNEVVINDSFMHIARTCALIIHSMKSCSRILKMNVYVCAWTNSILTNNFLQTIYFSNIWNLTEEEDGKIILLEKFTIGLSSKQSYKYHKFEDGMRALQQIFVEA